MKAGIRADVASEQAVKIPMNPHESSSGRFSNESLLDTQFLETVLSSKRASPSTEKLRMLLDLGAHIDGPNRDGMPIRHALTKNSEALVNFLIDSHANVHAELPGRQITSTLLHWASYQARPAKYVGDLAQRTMLTNIVSIIAAGAEPAKLNGANRPPESLLGEDLPAIFKIAFSSPLHAAIDLGRPDLCLELLDLGYDPDTKNSNRSSAWSFAKKSPECLGAMQAWLANQAIEKLLKKGIPLSP